MRSGALILLLLIWSSAVSSAPAEGSPRPEFSLGDEVLKKQEECEGIISNAIDEMLDDDNTNPHEDILVADDDYHECKEDLDKLKQKYMTKYNIDRSAYTEFFPVRINEGSTELISLPAEEGAEINDLEFDVNEELCVTSKKCTNILGLMEEENVKEKNYQERFARCHVLLDMIKHKYIQEKELNEKKLKEIGGLNVTCNGKPLLMTLPQFINNLDYHMSPHFLLGDTFNGVSTPEESSPDESHAEEHQEPADERPTTEVEKHGEHKPDEGTSKDVKGTSSKAVIGKANLISCVLFIFVLVTMI